MKTSAIPRYSLFSPYARAMALDEQGAYVEYAAHAERDAAQSRDILNLHLQLAGAQLQARNGWERYKGANASRLVIESKLQQAQDELSAARAEIARLQSVLGQAQALALQDAPSWGHRIAGMYAALGLDCGGADRINYALADEVLGPVGDEGEVSPVASKAPACPAIPGVEGLPERDKRELALFAQALKNDACPYCAQPVCPKTAGKGSAGTDAAA